MTHDMAPPLLAVAVLLLVINLARQRRNGKPLPLVLRSVPAVSLGGLAGAFVDLRHR